MYREWGVLVSYYLPGNSLAPPPSHRASGATAQVVVEHAILGSVIFHPTWAVAEWWSTLILPVCDPPQPVCGHYNDAPSYFHCLAMKSAPSFSHMGGGWPIYDAKSLIFYALNILLGVKAVVAKLDVALVMTLLAKFRN